MDYYNLLINGVYWGYNPFTNLLLTSWDIQVVSSIDWDVFFLNLGGFMESGSLHQGIFGTFWAGEIPLSL